jgi:hypothetical protein
MLQEVQVLYLINEMFEHPLSLSLAWGLLVFRDAGVRTGLLELFVIRGNPLSLSSLPLKLLILQEL